MRHLPYTIFILASLARAQENNLNERFEELAPLVIESTPLESNASKVTQAWSVLDKSELKNVKSDTIADTLANQPGIHQTFFGPSANRPIVRGLDKHRVRILGNGLEAFDFSASSEDHAVAIDPMFVERIELLRGASALLYGSNAIGGAVNVIDRSIPTRSYAGASGAVFRSGYNSVNYGWNAGAMGYAGSESLSFQINGFMRDADDYESPIGKVANSRGESHSHGLGGSYLLDGGYVGFSFSQMENVYGVPGAHASNETRVELETDRFEARSEIEVLDSDWLRGIELNLGYGDYRHDEIGKNAAGIFHTHSSFLRDGIEVRTALIHEIGPLRGVIGLHGLLDELQIKGDKTIFSGVIPAHPQAISSEDSSKLAIFLIEEFDLSESTRLNGGIRWEYYDREFVSEISDRDDSIFSASGGLSRDLHESWNLSANLSYTERAPETSELYSNGPHHGSETFDVGNPDLDIETALGVEIILRRTLGKVTGQCSAFYTRFDNYVFQKDTGLPYLDFVTGEGMLQWKYTGADTDFRGLEAEIDWLAMENEGWSLLLSAYGDLLRAKNLTEGTHLPRIPPARVGVGFEVQAEKLGFGMNLNRVFKQNRAPEVEDPHAGHNHGGVIHEPEPSATAAYTLLNASVTYDINFSRSQSEIYLRGYNLTDELAKVHTSFLKPYAPLPGAGVEVGLRIDF